MPINVNAKPVAAIGCIRACFSHGPKVEGLNGCWLLTGVLVVCGGIRAFYVHAKKSAGLHPNKLSDIRRG